MAKTRRTVGVSSPGKGGIVHGVKKPSKDANKNIIASLKSVGKSVSKGKERLTLGEVTNLNLGGRRTRKSNIVEKWEMKHEEGVKEEDVKKEDTADDDPEMAGWEMKHDEGVKEEDVKKEDTVDDDPEMAGLCEYERIRLSNIRERQAMFAQLEIGEAKASFQLVSSPASKPKGVSQRGLAGEGRVKEQLPLRPKSARIAGGKVPEIQRFVPEIDDPEEPEGLPLVPLSISDSLKNSNESKTASASKLLSKLSSSKQAKEILPPVTSSGTGPFAKLKLSDEMVAKVTPGRIFSLVIHSGLDRVVVAAGDKYGGVGMWDVEDTDSPTNGVHLFQPHSKPVNCMTWDMANTNNLITTSYDGTVRLLDCEKQEHSLLYGEEEFISWGGWTSFHSQVDRDTLLVSQGNTGSVALVDRRVGWEKATSHYHLFHKTHAKSVWSHPSRPELLLAGNNKGGCYVFDLRTGGGSKVMTPCTALLGHSRSLSSCQFSPQGDQVVTIATDDKILLFNTSTLPASLSPKCQIRHNNQTGRWLTPFRSTWHPARQGVFFTGSMERPRQIEVWSSKGDNLERTALMRDDLLGSVCSLVAVHPEREIVVGGNSSGRVHCFM